MAVAGRDTGAGAFSEALGFPPSGADTFSNSRFTSQMTSDETVGHLHETRAVDQVSSHCTLRTCPMSQTDIYIFPYILTSLEKGGLCGSLDVVAVVACPSMCTDTCPPLGMHPRDSTASPALLWRCGHPAFGDIWKGWPWRGSFRNPSTDLLCCRFIFRSAQE